MTIGHWEPILHTSTTQGNKRLRPPECGQRQPQQNNLTGEHFIVNQTSKAQWHTSKTLPVTRDRNTHSSAIQKNHATGTFEKSRGVKDGTREESSRGPTFRITVLKSSSLTQDGTHCSAVWTSITSLHNRPRRAALLNTRVWRAESLGGESVRD